MNKREYKLIIAAFVMMSCVFFYNTVNLYIDINRSDLNLKAVEKEMIEILNNYRVENSLSPLKRGAWLEKGASTRANEMAYYGSHRYITESGVEMPHTRPDGSSWNTAFDDILGKNGKSRFLSENIVLAMVSKRENERGVAQIMFDTFKDSTAHNEAMLDKDNKRIAFRIAKIPIHVDSDEVVNGRDTYIGVQIFDTYDNND